MPNATPEITLFAHNLMRLFGNRQVIHNVSLELKCGEVLGLLGHSGAGKSTTLQILTGCLLPDGGAIEICDIDLLHQPILAKAHIGYLPETTPLYREFSVDDYLTFAALIQTRQRCGLEADGKKIIGTLSKGYQQRVGIAQAIIHRPAVIVLDEPTVGLDPTQIRDIRTLIRELGDSSSVILSTHLLGEVQSACDRVEIMQHGKLIYDDTSARMQQYGRTSGFIEQRIVVVGNGAFLANNLAGNSGNVDLGASMVNWLASEEHLITLQPCAAKDSNLMLSKTQLAGIGFLIGLPLLLAGVGVNIWWKCRRAN